MAATDDHGRPADGDETGGNAAAPIGFWEWRRDGKTVVCSRALADILGLDAGDRLLSYRHFLRSVHPRDRIRVVEAVRRARRRGGGFRIHCRYRRPDGAEIILYQEAVDPEAGPPDGNPVVGIARDLTRQIRDEERVRHLAYFDTLTGLPNRVFLLEFLNQRLATARRRREGLAVLFVDLDAFKSANDSHGHDTGDALLGQVGERLVDCVRMKRRRPTDTEGDAPLSALAPGDIAARLGGDEFVVVLPDIGGADNAAAVARRIVDRLSRPFRVDGIDISLSASIGVSLYPGDGGDARGLLDKADAAMYRAKTGGGGRSVASADAAAGPRRSGPPIAPLADDDPARATGRRSELCHWEMTVL